MILPHDFPEKMGHFWGFPISSGPAEPRQLRRAGLGLRGMDDQDVDRKKHSELEVGLEWFGTSINLEWNFNFD